MTDEELVKRLRARSARMQMPTPQTSSPPTSELLTKGADRLAALSASVSQEAVDHMGMIESAHQRGLREGLEMAAKEARKAESDCSRGGMPEAEIACGLLAEWAEALASKEKDHEHQ